MCDNKVLSDFLEKKYVNKVLDDGMEQEVCNSETGECYVLRSKDGLVERINKKFITEDGRTLLVD